MALRMQMQVSHAARACISVHLGMWVKPQGSRVWAQRLFSAAAAIRNV